MHAEPLEQHHWFDKFVGEWVSECQAVMAPGEPPVTTRGIERCRLLGGLWMVAEGESEMPGGGTATMIMTLGYDAAKKQYLGTWVGSMMTHLWIYKGTLDTAGRTLTLDSEGPSFISQGKTSRYQDIITFESNDHRTLTSRAEVEDGKWREFMTAHYRRKT